VIPALLAAAWLLPAFPLLLAGRLSARPMVFMFAPLAAGLCYFAVRQLPAAWPAFREASKAKAKDGKPATSRPARAHWWALAATVAIAVAFTVWQLADVPSRSSTSAIRHLPPGRLLDRAPRLSAHTRLGGRVRRRTWAWASPAPTTTRAAPASCPSS
jgi:hypothetical protein